MPINGLTSSQYNSYIDEARRVVATFDRNGDGRLTQDEMGGRVSQGADSYSFTDRVSSNYVNRTTVYQDTFVQALPGAFQAASRGNGSVTAEDLVDYYTQRNDTNRDGELSFWERQSMSTSDLRNTFENRTTVETDRRTTSEYDPSYYETPTTTYVDPYYNPYSNPYSTVVPPSPTYRPAPPPVYYPSYPSSSTVTPPSPSYRPAPPPVYSSGSSSSRPLPPASSSSRPTPPSIR